MTTEADGTIQSDEYLVLWCKGMYMKHVATGYPFLQQKKENQHGIWMMQVYLEHGC